MPNQKVAIVVGASSGIGEAVAIALSSIDIKLTLIARSSEKLASVVKKVGLDKSLAIAVDVTNDNDLINAIKHSHEYWGRTDFLINSAGSCIASNLHSGNKQDWQYMWQVNVYAPCLAIQEALKYFNPHTGGHIINISSTSAYRIVKGGSFYSATKFALRAISETFRKELIELKSRTKISSISPGLVNSGFAQPNDFIIPDNLDKEKLDPEDIAQGVLYIIQSKPHVAIQDIILRSYNQYN